jgi:ribosome biogenesis protein BMS1
MVDLSKVADVALIMIDASVGLEMETFEFMCFLKNHGFTSVMGVLTHMDQFRQNKSLSKLKKQIKKRFLKEATDKAKLFYLFGIKNQMYMKMQMHNLARYLKVIKPSIPGFRVNHPYIVSDRFDVNFLSNSDDPEEDVFVSFFGYVRGNNFSKNSTIHINGLGDYNIDYITKVDDPCPIETVEVKGKKKRTLKEKEKFLYAPYCNINSLEYDRNAGYITIPDRFVAFTKGISENANNIMDEGVQMVRKLQDMDDDVMNRQIDDGDIDLLEGVEYNNDDEEEEENMDEEYSEDSEVERMNKLNRKQQRKEKIENLVKDFNLKSEPSLYREATTHDMTKTIYDYTSTDDSSEDNIPDSYKFVKEPEFTLEFLIQNVKQRFLTGSSIIENEMGIEEEVEEDDSRPTKRKRNQARREDEEQENPEDYNEEEEQQQQKNTNNKTEEINLIKEFCNEEYGIFEKGVYVRVDIRKIKKKYIDHFKVDLPIILCTTNIQENSFGFLKIKLTKHLWHPKILKTNDPIIFSIGWRKFQTTPVYCMEDKNHKLRMIKYTPKFGACFAVAYGPLLPINVAVVAIQNYSNQAEHFRICGTGDLIEVNQNFEVMKKLKLIGEPYEIYKKTAFVKGMFNSGVNIY